MALRFDVVWRFIGRRIRMAIIGSSNYGLLAVPDSGQGKTEQVVMLRVLRESGL